MICEFRGVYLISSFTKMFIIVACGTTEISLGLSHRNFSFIKEVIDGIVINGFNFLVSNRRICN